jgi:ABC-type multidrug transport system permease subunit
MYLSAIWSTLEESAVVLGIFVVLAMISLFGLRRTSVLSAIVFIAHIICLLVYDICQSHSVGPCHLHPTRCSFNVSLEIDY